MRVQLPMWCESGVHHWVKFQAGNILYCRHCSLTYNLRVFALMQRPMGPPLPEILGPGWPTVG